MAEENAVLTAPQKSPATYEVATASQDIDIFTGWITRMENPDEVLRYESAGRGVRLYEELERDWQVHSMLQTRALALEACEWNVEPASDKKSDVKIADFVTLALKGTNFDRLCRDLSQAILTGYKPVEIMWEVSEGSCWIGEFRGRRPSRFVFDMDGNLRLLTPQKLFDGEPVPPRKFLIWTFGGHDHNPYGRGLGYQSFWPVWFKKHNIRYWLVFAEKFGSPTVVGKYPPGTSSEDKDTLLAAIAAIQQQTGIRIPNTMEINLLEAARAGTVNTYADLCEYMDRAIAKVILGQTLTSEQGKSGSYSLGQVHNEVRRDLLKSDADDQCEMLNRTVIRWLVDFNFPVAGRAAYPKVWRRTEPEQDLKALADRDKVILVDMGMGNRVPESYIEETYAIPLAKEGEKTVGAGPAPKTPQPGQAPSPAEPSPGTQFSETPFDQSAVDRLGDDAIRAAADELDVLLKPVLEFIAEAKSLEEIGERIFEFYPRLDPARFQELLARALFAAGLTGYAGGGNG